MVYNKAWETGYTRDRARGVRRYVEATDTRAILRGFLEAKVPLRALARSTGLSDTAIGAIIEGRRTHVQRSTAAKAAALTLADVYGQAGGTVPAVGTTRRVQALMAIGWRKPDLATAGIPSAQLVTRARSHVTAATWRQVGEVYDRLSMTPGPSASARERATRRGYAPPLAWDEDALDDPRATPQFGRPGDDTVDPVAVASVATGQGGKPSHVTLNSDERLAATRDLTSRGASVHDIAGTLGVCDRTVTRWRQQFGATGQHTSTANVSAECQNATSSDRLNRSQQLDRSVRAMPTRSVASRVL